MKNPKASVAIVASLLAVGSPSANGDEDWNRALNAADSALTKGDYKEAQRRLTSAVKRAASFGPADWRSAGAEFNLGNVHLASGALDQAAATLDKAQAKYIKLFSAKGGPLIASHAALGQLALVRGELPKAKTKFNEALTAAQTHPDSLRVAPLLGLASIARIQGEWTRAETHLAAAEQSARSAPKEVQARVQVERAQLAMAQGDRESANTALRQAADAVENSPERAVYVAEITLAQATIAQVWGQLTTAHETFKAAQELWESNAREHPGAARTLIGLADLQAQLGNLREAELSIQRAVTLVERSEHASSQLIAQTRLAQARLAIRQGNPAAALTAARRAQKAAQNTTQSIQAQVIAARAHLDMGNRAEASNTVTALKAASDSVAPSATKLDRALLVAAQGQINAGLSRYQNAAEDTIKATSMLDAAGLSNRPLRYELDIELAQYLRDGGQFGKAAQQLERALQTLRRGSAPESLFVVKALHARAVLEQRKGLSAQAIATVTEARSAAVRVVGNSSPLHAHLLYTQGLAELDAGMSSQSQATLASALLAARKASSTRNPGLAKFQLALADAQLRAGKNREANDAIRAAKGLIRNTKADGIVLAELSLLSAASEARAGRYRSAAKHLDTSLQAIEGWPKSPAIQATHLRISILRATIASATGKVSNAVDMLGSSAPSVGPIRLAWAVARTNALVSVGRADDAAQFSSDQLASFSENLPTDQLLSAKAAALAEVGAIEESLATQAEAVEQARRYFKDGHARVWQAELAEVALDRKAGRVGDATASLDRVVPAIRTLFGEDHPAVADALTEQGHVAVAGGHFTAALEAYIQAQAILEKSLRSDHPQVLSLGLARADALSDLGKNSDAIALIRLLQSTIKRAGITNHAVYGEAMLRASIIHIGRVDIAAGQKAFDESREAVNRLADSHPLHALSALVESHLAVAKDAYQVANDILGKARLNAAGPLFGRLVAAQANAVLRSKGPAAARQLLEEARLNMEAQLPPGHPARGAVTSVRVAVLTAEARWEEALSALSVDIDGINAVAQNHVAALRLVLQVCGLLNETGRTDEALQRAKEAATTIEQHLSPDHPLIGDALRAQGIALYHQGQYDAAENALKRARKIHERASGSQHPDSIADLIQLTHVLRAQGRQAEAIQLVSRTLSRITKVPQLSQWTGRLELTGGWIKHEQGDFSGAKKYFKAARDRFKGHGIDGAQAEAQYALALMAMELGDPVTSTTIAAQTLTIKGFSPEVSVSHAAAHLVMAAAAMRDGDTIRSNTAVAAAREAVEQVYGAEHTAALKVLSDAGHLWSRNGSAEPAIDLTQQALNLSRSLLGDDHPRTTQALVAAANALIVGDDVDGARALIVQASERNNAVSDWLKAMIATAEGAAAPSNKEAIDALERAISLSEQAYGNKHPLVAERQIKLANRLLAQGRVHEGEPLLTRALGILEATLGKTHTSLIPVIGMLGETHLRLRKRGSAAKHLERQIAILEATADAPDMRLSRALTNLAAVRIEGNRLDDAVPLLQRANDIAEKSQPNTISSAQANSRLAEQLVALEDFEGAAALYQTALEVFSRDLTTDDSRLINTLRSLAALNMLKGDYDGAARLLQRAG
jgi:ATP/maltotriose-dependent transcriptional regulator MalT